MNSFTDIVTIFIFVFVFIYYVVNIHTTNIILQKIYLFLAVLIFGFFLEFAKTMKTTDKANLWTIINGALLVAVCTYVAHTTMYDVMNDDEMNTYMMKLKLYLSDEIILAIFVTVCVTVGKLLRSILCASC